jgi:hypothetical protein
VPQTRVATLLAAVRTRRAHHVVIKSFGADFGLCLIDVLWLRRFLSAVFDDLGPQILEWSLDQLPFSLTPAPIFRLGVSPSEIEAKCPPQGAVILVPQRPQIPGIPLADEPVVGLYLSREGAQGIAQFWSAVVSGQNQLPGQQVFQALDKAVNHPAPTRTCPDCSQNFAYYKPSWSKDGRLNGIQCPACGREGGAAQGPQAKGQRATIVPPGHEVIVYQAGPEASIIETRGHMWLVNFGTKSSEAPPDHIPNLFEQVEATLARDRGQALYGIANTLHELFAPADPKVQSRPSGVVWLIQRESLRGWVEDPMRLQDLLRHFYRVSNTRRPIEPSGPLSLGGLRPQSAQIAVFLDEAFPNARLLGELLRGLGFDVRRATPAGESLVEVVRPEGVVLVCLAGTPFFPPDGEQGDDYVRRVNQAKDQAQTQPRRQHIEERERAYLAQRLIHAQTELS